MKLILVIALILAIIGSFGDCAPTDKKSAASSKNEEGSSGEKGDAFILIGDPKDSLWPTQKDFDHLVEQAGNMYGPASAEKEFLEVLASVINKNLKMFKQIWDYTYFFENIEAIWCQVSFSARHRQLRDPSDKILLFRMQLIQLLEFVSTSHEKVEPLFFLLNIMDPRTKIDQKSLNRLRSEAKKVNQIYQHFEELFKEFPVEPYMTKVNDIRKTIDDFAGDLMEKVEAFKSSEYLDIRGALFKKYDEIETKLNAAYGIDFASLIKATNEIYSVASEALHNNGASSSN